VGSDKASLIRQQRKILLLLLLMMIIMNMQNKLHTTQFLSWPDDRFTTSSWAVIEEHQTREFFRISQNSQKKMNSWKSWISRQERIWTHGKVKSRKKKKDSCSPSQPPFTNRARCPWYGTFPLASRALCLAVLPPSSCTPAH